MKVATFTLIACFSLVCSEKVSFSPEDVVLLTTDRDSLFDIDARLAFRNLLDVESSSTKKVVRQVFSRPEKIVWFNMVNPVSDPELLKALLDENQRRKAGQFPKCIVVIHMWTFVMPSKNTRDESRVSLDAMKKISLADARRLAAIMIYTKTIAKAYQKLGINAPFTRTWPKYLPTAKKTSSLSVAHKVHVQGKFIFTSSGSSGARRSRDIPTLLNAFQRLVISGKAVDVTLVIAVNEQQNLVQKTVRNNVCKGTHNCLGLSMNRAIHREYVKNSMFVVLPIRGGMKNLERGTTVVVESLAQGRPVIANSFPPSFDGYIIDGKNGFLVPPQNITSLANKMAALLNDARLYSEMLSFSESTKANFSAVQGDGIRTVYEACKDYL